MPSLFIDKKGREVSIPLLHAPVADTHCHLLSLEDPEYGSGDKALYTSAADALCRAYFVGLAFIVVLSDPAETYEDAGQLFLDFEKLKEEGSLLIKQRLNESWKKPKFFEGLAESDCLPQNMRLATGCHPHNASSYDEKAEARLIQVISDERCSALGEIGLDYFYDFSPRDIQITVFKRQLEIAKELGVPVALHIRDAHDDAYQILKDCGLPEAGCLLHCFNLGPETYKKFEDLGCKFSIGGPLTFSQAGIEVREAMKIAHLENLMSETDSPYMAPAPFRGFKCEPAFTVFTMQKFLDIFTEAGFSPEYICEILYKNALDFYRQ